MCRLKSLTSFVRTFAMVAVVMLAAILVSSTCDAQVKVACVGDSITAGYALSNPGADSYPAQLQVLLGKDYTVGSYGLSGSSLQKRGYTFWDSWPYKQSMDFKPDIVVIMLGTNDSKPGNWHAQEFNADYKALIDQYAALSSRPKIYICLIAPVFLPTAFGKDFDPKVIQETVVPAIRQIGEQTGRPIIDNNTPLLNKANCFIDGVHPTPTGAGIIAASVKKAIAP